jgi:hypothetical protein
LVLAERQGGRLSPQPSPACGGEPNLTGRLPSPKEPSSSTIFNDPPKNGTASREHADRAESLSGGVPSHENGQIHTKMTRNERVQNGSSTLNSGAGRPVQTSHDGLTAAPVRHGSSTSDRSRHPERFTHLGAAPPAIRHGSRTSNSRADRNGFAPRSHCSSLVRISHLRLEGTMATGTVMHLGFPPLSAQLPGEDHVTRKWTDPHEQ